MFPRQLGVSVRLRQAHVWKWIWRRDVHLEMALRPPKEVVGHVYAKLAKKELAGLKPLKNKLIRYLDEGYLDFVADMRLAGILQPDIVQMIFYQTAGPRQYQAFVDSLRQIISSDATVEHKKQQLYTLVKLQRKLFPQSTFERGILLPEFFHEWFWQHLHKGESFSHFHFLVKSNVLLGSRAAHRLLVRLLKGSEIEQHLATFQIFLNGPQGHRKYFRRITKLCTFAQINVITSALLSKKDLRHINSYFTALLDRLESWELNDSTLTQEKRIALFVKFTNTLLKLLQESRNVDMFLDTFKVVLGLVHSQKLDLSLLHKPFLSAIQFLRALNEHSHVLRLISSAQELNLQSSFKFKQSLICELVSTLRSFNDPKMILSYIATVYCNPVTMPFLNELGLWGLVHHGSVYRLSPSQLETDSQTLILQKSQISQFLTKNLIPNAVVLTELYRVTLHYMQKTMSSPEFRQLIIDLYQNYKRTLETHRNYFRHPDCGILNVLIHHLRFSVREDRLAYQLLEDFYRTKPRVACKGCSPFGLAMYHNCTLTKTEISSLLVLMDENDLKLDFKVICGMVFYHLRSGQVDEAHAWYTKLCSVGFSISHKLLIQRALENGWKLPKNTDTTFLKETEEDVQDAPEEMDDLVSDDLMEEEIDGTTGFAEEILNAVGSVKDQE
ncbi:LAME_0D02300g1_1 [Lachancea meyersii CBS 8951]|uniref:LAME_0D02300g1_1 n=1 Tax=Lachancea meyersii CBS 8951 TaxID=1266667 RepID=A0A1G4J740_9SACH|nr:LAME_0D02300g1_1 [Lachancea meyersii CBS 8951]